MNTIKILAVVLFTAVSAFGQDLYIAAGAGGDYLIPLAGFKDRFKPAPGFHITAGKRTSADWQWNGRLEYFKASGINSSGIIKHVEIETGGGTGTFAFPLTGLTMNFETVGLSAEARYFILDSDVLQTSLNFSFGFFYWDFKREQYSSSVNLGTGDDGNPIIYQTNVPGNRQTDWSGGFNGGVDLNVKIFGPLWFNAGAGYKLIAGELWPALELDMENVSSFQLLNLKAGIFARF